MRLNRILWVTTGSTMSVLCIAGMIWQQAAMALSCPIFALYGLYLWCWWQSGRAQAHEIRLRQQRAAIEADACRAFDEYYTEKCRRELMGVASHAEV